MTQPLGFRHKRRKRLRRMAPELALEVNFLIREASCMSVANRCAWPTVGLAARDSSR